MKRKPSFQEGVDAVADDLKDLFFLLVLACLDAAGVYLMIQGGGWLILGFPLSILSLGLILKLFQ